VANRRSQKGRSGNSPSNKCTCIKCGKKHMGECLVGMDNCIGCGKSGDKVRDFPNIRGQEKGSVQVQASGPRCDALKRNRLYVFLCRSDQEESPNVITSMLQVFSINVYDLLDPLLVYHL